MNDNMKDNINRISQAELEVMKILWQANGPVSTGDIYKELSEQMGWDRSTVRTLLKRLTEKGSVITNKLKVLNYLPVVSEKEYCDVQTKNFVERLYGGSAKRLVSSLVENYNLTTTDIEELRELLNSGGGKDE
ncbi:MAG: transcriptional repressor, CopY family [Herbinix sp.]|jgi:BlaI family penicillinase repressor|nr:transcriptional repressor, CopY family [Herbinix sp.]